MKEALIHSLSREEVQIKMTRVEPTESRSQEIADELSLMVFDQPEACRAVGRRLAMFETNLSDPNRPLGVLYFVGPPGSGKTEMSRAISQYMFQDPDSDRTKILNMSEYAEDHYAARFTGSPPGYVDYDKPPVIEHGWLHKGRSLLVLDEIEKAAPKVIRTLLPMLDRGRLDARNGRQGVEPLDFRNSLIIMTSNVASGEVKDILAGRKQGIGFGAGEVGDRKQKAAEVTQKGLRDKFPAEFIDRIDDVVMFNQLENPETLNAIITKFLGERNDHLREVLSNSAPFIALTNEAREFLLAQAGKEGGRAIKKALELYIFDRMADVIASIDYARRPFVADIVDGVTEWYTDDPAVEVVDITPQRNTSTNIVPFRQIEPPDDMDPDDLVDGDSLKKKFEGEEDEQGDAPPGGPYTDDDITHSEEEVPGEKTKMNLAFILPNNPPTHEIDLLVTVRERETGEEKVQHFKGFPLVPTIRE